MHTTKLLARGEVGRRVLLHEEFEERVSGLEPYVATRLIGDHHEIEADGPPVGCRGHVVNGLEHGRVAKSIKPPPHLLDLKWRRGKTCSGFNHAIPPGEPDRNGAIALLISDNDPAKIVRRGP